MAATVGRIVLMVTGGYAGSALYSYRDSLPQVFGSTLRDFANLLKISNSGGSSSGLEKQVEMLSQDMRAMMLSGRGGTIVLSSSQGSVFSRVWTFVSKIVHDLSVFFWYSISTYYPSAFFLDYPDSRSWHRYISLV
jgi:hypothetical protein